ncbi:hypothetical protein LCGC14_0602160 [marine sediment metagenome]|uniref:Uncharacterized protein n=1 Tax=marine sediment metagenome TaxID=412755 RepID=A0A0F9UIR8_9ZZZZ
MKIDTKQEDHFFFDAGRQGKIFLAFLLVFFVFFGIISEVWKRNIREELIWIVATFPFIDEWFFTQVLGLSALQNWNFIGIIPILILFFTCFILTYKEDIYLYGIKHSLWLVPFILGCSVFWYYYIHYWRPSEGATWTPISPFLLLFGSWQGWLNILILFSINLFGALAGWQVKELVRIYIKKEEALLMKRLDSEEEKGIESKIS